MADKEKNNSYEFVWSNCQYLLTVEMSISVFLLRKKDLWISLDNVFYFVKNNNIKCFHNLKDINKDKKRGKRFFDKSYVDNFLRQVEKKHKETWKLFEKLKKTKFNSLSNHELVSYLEKGKNDWMGQILMFNAIQDASTRVLSDEIKKHFNEEDFDIVMHRTEKDAADLERKDQMRLSKKEKITNKELLEHADKYPWIVAAHLDMKDVKDTLRNRWENDKKEIKITEKKRDDNYAKKVAEKAPRKVRDYILSFHKLSLSRMKIKSCWAGMDYYFMPLMYEIAKRTGENVRDLNKYYFSWDIKNILFSEKKLSQKDKRDRDKCVAALWKNGKLTFKYGEAGLKLAKRELGSLVEAQKKKKIKGTIANRGKKEGIARILLANNIENAKKMRKDFRQGEILVTQMTQPNIIDIAKKAGAIVTDEGGMLSHAAIISREFNIPCIVGTHSATDILKDGDLVEVDANKGVVSILGRK